MGDHRRGFWEEGAPAFLPLHIPGVGMGRGFPSGPGAGFPFPLTLIDQKSGLILLVGGEALPRLLFPLLFRSCPPPREGDSEKSLTAEGGT